MRRENYSYKRKKLPCLPLAYRFAAYSPHFREESRQLYKLGSSAWFSLEVYPQNIGDSDNTQERFFRPQNLELTVI